MRKYIFGSVFLLVLLAVYLYALPLLRTGAGYGAKMICSCVYVEGATPNVDSLRDARLNFSILDRLSLHHDLENSRITASFFGIAGREARFIEGRGCVLRSDDRLPWPPALPPLPAYGTTAESDRSLAPDSTTSRGVDVEALTTALENGMQRIPGGGAHAIVVLRGGKLLAERYAKGITPDSRLLGWSMAKSLTAALLGVRIEENEVSRLKYPVFPEWDVSNDQSDPRSKIFLESLLRMNSGLRWDEAYGSVTDVTVMLYDQADMASYARKQPLVHPIAEHWNYSSGTSNLVMDVIRSSFTDDVAMQRWLYNQFFYAINANSFIIESDQSGLPVGSSYAWARARDWAKLGQLFLQNGNWEGRQVFPDDWVEYLLLPAKGSDGVYGGHVWLKGADTPAMPDDAYAFQGFQGQRLFVLPSHDLVIVRIGHNDNKVTDFNRLLKEILAAVPPVDTSTIDEM